MSRILRIAAYGGIFSLILIPPEIYLEHILNENPGIKWLFPLIVIIYLISVLSTVALYYGFYRIGKTLSSSAIIASSLIIISLKIIWYVFQYFAIQEPISFFGLFGGIILVIFGISRIIFGYGIYKVRLKLGKPAISIAYFEFAIGLLLVPVFTYPGALFLSIIVSILQIILLFRLSKNLVI